jgi:hypothetical protein
MFRMVPPPIIRSANNCIYRIRYLSQRYCYLLLSWKSWNRFECAVGGVRQQSVYFTTKLCFSFIRGAWKVVHEKQKVRKLPFWNSFSKQRRALKLSKQMNQTTYFSIFNLPYELEVFVVWLKFDYMCWLECLNRGTVQFHGLILLFWSFDGKNSERPNATTPLVLLHLTNGFHFPLITLTLLCDWQTFNVCERHSKRG